MELMIICIHKMINSATTDYFRYFAATPDLRRWGLGVTAAGRTKIDPGAMYPPPLHPDDHCLKWSHGRVLEALQVVLIPSGGGWLETRATGSLRVEAGMVFMLIPGIWHRYRPDPTTGWTESWIEVQGPVVDELLLGGIFPITRILHQGAIDSGIEETLDKIHQRILQGADGFQPELSAAAMQLLAQCSRVSQNQVQVPHIQSAVNKAERFLSEHHAEPINVEELAAKLGVAYSHFRRAFRTQTGHSPWKYVIHLRLKRARRLLASSDAKLDDIAARVGFSSGFHLSHSFKQAYGESPDTWRRKLAKVHRG